MATKAVASGPHASRFYVTPAACDQQQQLPLTGAQPEDESGFEVSILDSLPWNRSDPGSAGFLADHSACDAVEEKNSLPADDGPGDVLTAALNEEDCTLTARLAKSLSQLRLSASGSCANFRSVECGCNCCSASAASCGSRPRGAAAAAAGHDIGFPACQEDAEPQHLGLPWSQASCSGSRCTFSQRSQCSRDAACASPGSLHQLAAARRSERLTARCSSFRRKVSFGHSLAQHDCPEEPSCQEEYYSQLRERVELWLRQTDDQCQPPVADMEDEVEKEEQEEEEEEEEVLVDEEGEDEEQEGERTSDRCRAGATFFLGNQGP